MIENLITNSHFKTIFFAQITGTLNPPQNDTVSAVKRTKKYDNTFEEKINNMSLWFLEIFCLPMSRLQETFKLFLCICIF